VLFLALSRRRLLITGHHLIEEGNPKQYAQVSCLFALLFPPFAQGALLNLPVQIAITKLFYRFSSNNII
jgi:hypothetical protein